MIGHGSGKAKQVTDLSILLEAHRARITACQFQCIHVSMTCAPTTWNTWLGLRGLIQQHIEYCDKTLAQEETGFQSSAYQGQLPKGRPAIWITDWGSSQSHGVADSVPLLLRCMYQADAPMLATDPKGLVNSVDAGYLCHCYTNLQRFVVEFLRSLTGCPLWRGDRITVSLGKSAAFGTGWNLGSLLTTQDVGCSRSWGGMALSLR